MHVRPIFALALLLASACSTTSTTTTSSPITGVIIRSESLVGAHGCGTATGQVYKYAAIVSDDAGTAQAWAQWDCFADGTFTNLVGSSAGSYTFSLQVFAFDKPTYDVHGNDIAAALPSPGPGAMPDALSLSQIETYGATCKATQQTNVEVLAVCNPLR